MESYFIKNSSIACGFDSSRFQFSSFRSDDRGRDILFPGIGKSMYYAIQTMDAELLSALLFYSGLTFYIFSRVSIRFQESLTGKENLF